jgi:hypothetical protein
VTERFYFDIENGTVTIHDEEGVEADDLNSALEEARSVIIEMVDEIAEDVPGETWILVVRDAAGALVARLPIKK